MHFQDILLQIRVTGHAILAQVAGSNHDGKITWGPLSLSMPVCWVS